MSLAPSYQREQNVSQGHSLFAQRILAVWFTLVVLAGVAGAFVTAPGTPPLRLLIGFAAPVIVFFAAFWLSAPFRDFVLAADLRLMTGIQAWRFAGLGFLALYTHRVLPGIFAWPAGLGDIAIGVTAPWILVALIRQPSFATSKTFVLWNVLGVLDLVVAMGTGALGSVLAAGVAGEVTTRPMAQWPLVLLPAYLVPVFFMLHTAALVQARQAIRSAPV